MAWEFAETPQASCNHFAIPASRISMRMGMVA